MEDFASLEQRVRAIEERNLRVEAAKAWESSPVRILSVLILTYIVVTLALLAIGTEHAFRNALIPTLGFFLSVQSLPFLKKAWIDRKLKKNI